MSEEPEWNATNVNRKAGSTTLKQCGWCEYSCGSIRYNCTLSGRCDLLKSFENNIKWNTKCIISRLGKKDLQSILNHKKYLIEENKKQTQYTKEEMAIICKLKVTLPNKPPLVDNRIDEYNDGEVVWVYLHNKWNRGIVVGGYRSHDGCVSYILDDEPNSRPPPQGNGPWGCGVLVPCILKDWEYNYFKKHKKEFKQWLIDNDRKYNGKSLISIDEMMEI